jgi:hypothetical protein
LFTDFHIFHNSFFSFFVIHSFSFVAGEIERTERGITIFSNAWFYSFATFFLGFVYNCFLQPCLRARFHRCYQGGSVAKKVR